MYLYSLPDVVAHIYILTDRLTGFSGIIQKMCKPDEVAHNAATDATNLCFRYTGTAPPIKVVCKTNKTTITYVSSHIHYMLTELLKNSLRAVVDAHGADCEALPPVTVVIVRGEEDITIRVSDEGGGIPRSQVRQMCEKRPVYMKRDLKKRPMYL